MQFFVFFKYCNALNHINWSHKLNAKFSHVNIAIANSYIDIDLYCECVRRAKSRTKDESFASRPTLRTQIVMYWNAETEDINCFNYHSCHKFYSNFMIGMLFHSLSLPSLCSRWMDMMELEEMKTDGLFAVVSMMVSMTLSLCSSYRCVCVCVQIGLFGQTKCHTIEVRNSFNVFVGCWLFITRSIYLSALAIFRIQLDQAAFHLDLCVCVRVCVRQYKTQNTTNICCLSQ